MASIGLEVATLADLEEAHALVARRVGPPIASMSVMRSVHQHTGSTVFVARQDGAIAGVVAELPLTAAGREAVEAGAFNGLDPHLSHLAEPGEDVAAMYCWGVAAEGRRAAALVVKAVVVARNEIYAALPFFTRAAPPAGSDPDQGSLGGHAALRRFGGGFYPGQPNLIFSPAAPGAGRSAA